MGQSAEELRREIADTRAELSGTFDAIGDRVSPSRMIQRRRNKVSRGMHSMRERVMGTAHDTHASLADSKDSALQSVSDVPDMVRSRTEGAPMVAGALAFGVGFMVAAALPPSQGEKQVSVKLLEKAEPLKAQLSEAAHEAADHLKEPARQAADQIKDAVSEGTHQVSDTAKHGLDDARQVAGDTNTGAGQLRQ